MSVHFLCIGACNIDQTVQTQAAVVFGSSQPVTTTSGFGGVARNVALNLRRLDCRAGLLTLLGNDHAGRAMLKSCAAGGIEIAGSETSDEASSPHYTAVLDNEGRLIVGLADMAVYDLMTPNWLEARRAVIAEADVILADANLPQASLAWLADQIGPEQIFCAEAVSDVKALRLQGILERLDHLFCNGGEAAALTGAAVTRPAEAATACRGLASFGCKQATVSLAENGLVAIDTDGNVHRLAAPNVRPVDPTGAGDALIAALLFALYEERVPLIQALALARAAAAMTLECQASIADGLTRQSLHARAAGEEAEAAR